MAPQQNGGRWLESHAFILMARVSSVLGTVVAGFAVWIFLQAWQDIRTMNDALALLSGTVRVHEFAVADHGRRLNNLEASAYKRPLAPAPQP